MLVNVFAVLLLAGGVFGLYRYFRAQERRVGTSRAEFVSGEARLIRRLQEESEERMAAKDREIGEIQDRLAQLDQERLNIEENIEAQISAREEELRRQYVDRLEAERQRLQSEGLSERQIAGRIESMEAEQQSDLEEAIERARREAQAEQERLESNLTALRREYDEALRTAQNEQLSLREEAQRLADEVESEYEQRVAASQEELAQAMARLNNLSQQTEQAARVREQIAGYYDAVRRSMREDQYAEALGTLSDLRGFLFSSAVDQLPSIAAQRSAEVFVIDSLAELARAEQKAAGTSTDALLDAARRLSTIAELVDQARAEVEANRPSSAAELYSQAMRIVPQLEESHLFVTQQITEELRREHTRALAAARTEREAEVAAVREDAAGELDAAMAAAERRLEEELALAERESRRELTQALREARREAAAELAEALAQAAEEAEVALSARERELSAEVARHEATKRELEAERASERRWRERSSQLSSQIASLRETREELATRIAAVGESLDPSSEGRSAQPTGSALSGLTSMLDTKVTLRQVLSSEFVRSQHPDLYHETDAYIGALAAESEARGRREALAEVFSLIDALANGGSESFDPQNLTADFQDDESKRMLAAVLREISELAAPQSAP